MPLNLFSPCEFEIPHPPLSLSLLLVVEDAIRYAWRLLVECPPDGFDIINSVEETINHHLREVLQDQVWKQELVDGFNAQQIACVTSAEETRDYNGCSLKKRPDMVVKLVGIPECARPSQYGIFIECKPVDREHSAVSCYCKLGIQRFVNGYYAWAMREALMVAYVIGEVDPAQQLTAAFRRCKTEILPISTTAYCSLSVVQGGFRTVITRHSRNFSYVETRMQAPEIQLRHVWLRRDQ